MMNRACRLFVFAFAIATAVFAAGTPEWPQFRGPQSNPVSNRRLLDTWSKTENIEWAAEIPGRGWSSPIVSGNKIFLTASVNEGKSKQPQIGTEYSNEYMAELMKQGLSAKEADATSVSAGCTWNLPRRADYLSGKRSSGACSIQTTRQNRKDFKPPWPPWGSGL